MTRANLLGPLDPIFDVATQYGALAAGNSPGTSGVAVTINKGSSQPDPAYDGPIVFDVVFGEDVTGFSGTDIVLSGTAGAITAVVAGSGSVYTVEVSGMDACGTVIARIPAGVCVAVSDGDPNRASTSTDNNVEFVMSYDYIVGVVGGAIWNTSFDELDTSTNYPDIIGYETRTDLGAGVIQYSWSTAIWTGSFDGAQHIWDGCVTGSRDIVDGIIVGGGGNGGGSAPAGGFPSGGGSGAEIIVFSDSLAPYPFPVDGLADVGGATVATVFGALTAAQGQTGGNNGSAGGNGYNGGGGGVVSGAGGTGTNFAGGNATSGANYPRGGGGAGATSAGTNATTGGFFDSNGAGYGGAGREWPAGSGLYFCGGGVGGVYANLGGRIGPNVSGGGGAGGVSTATTGGGGTRPGAGGGGAYQGSGGAGATGVITVNVEV